ncbi:hypothetical protein SLA2020_357700 [Shorea laevis]
MEMPGRRSNYSLLSQYPDDQYSVSISGAPPPFYDSLSSESNNNKTKSDRLVHDWDPNQQPANRIGGGSAFPSSIGLQRQSSGSSFGESSLSGDYYAPTLSVGAGSEIDALGYGKDDSSRFGEPRLPAADGLGGSASGKSWAQQTEESYQLQLALALRLSLEATCADDPNFLDPVPDESAMRTASSGSVETVSHRFWVGFIVILRP